jgi:hypothetical protein
MEDYEIIDYNWTVEWVFGERTQAFREGKKFYVDWSDYDKYVKGYRFMMNDGYVAYSSVKDGLCHKKLHRIILDCPEDMMIDHINHDKLNNSRSNLRIVTQQQNCMNKGKHKNNTSGIIGVNWHKKYKKWVAQINLNNKKIHIGLFDNFDEACKARKEAEIKYFGEFRNKDNE